MDFKLLNNMLDFKTYIAILDADLKTSNEYEHLKVLDRSYAKFLQN